MTEPADSCVKPAKGPVGTTETNDGAPVRAGVSKEGFEVRAQVGKAAPDFELSAFVDGGFKNVKLSDYAGKWVILCFYPGDFTFV